MKKALTTVCLAMCISFSCIMLLHSEDTAADYEHQETNDLVTRVKDAAKLIGSKGEAAFSELKKEGSPWKEGKKYVFVLDTDGNMLVHPDSALEGTNQMGLKDQEGKMFVKGLIEKVTGTPGKEEGWFHYQWPEPGSIFSKWKTTFAKRVKTPSGNIYVVCSGLYNIPMEKAFIIDTVNAAVALIEKEGTAAFPAIRDAANQFIYQDTYVFVDNPDGIELVNPAFTEVEGTSLWDYQDEEGKYFTRELIELALTKGSGWVNYLWPKPGQTKQSRKYTYVKKATYGDEVFIAGAGSYLESKIEETTKKLKVLELKSGKKIAAEVIRESKDSVYLALPAGTMQVSYPRSNIKNIRKPTDEELQKIRASLEKTQKQKEKEVTESSEGDLL
ncbi:MAG: cache domain-containing protein [Candidatus Omnitrophica bacterium]|nr:cache domain-containing protein [Candidatus Omnitrophota bacterium]